MSLYPTVASASDVPPVRRAWKWLRRRRVVSSAVAVVVVVLAVATYVHHAFWWIPPYPSPIRVTVAGGCLPAIGTLDGVRNPGLGFFFEMAPEHPTAGLVCVYDSSGPPSPGALLGQRKLGGPQASALAALADNASTTRPSVQGWACGGTDDLLIAFSYRGRSDVDLWIDGEANGCGLLTNGRLDTSTSFNDVPTPVVALPEP